MLKNMKIGWKISAACGMLLILMVVVGGVGISGMDNVSDQNLRLNIMSEAVHDMSSARLFALKYAKDKTPAAQKEFQNTIDATVRTMKAGLTAFDSSAQEEVDRAIQLVEKYKSSFTLFTDYEAEKQHAVKKCLTAAKSLSDTLTGLENKGTELLDQALQYSSTSGETSSIFKAYRDAVSIGRAFQNTRGFAKDFLRTYSRSIAENVQKSLKEMIDQSDRLAETTPFADVRTAASEAAQEARTYLTGFDAYAQKAFAQSATPKEMTLCGLQAQNICKKIMSRENAANIKAISTSTTLIISGLSPAILGGIIISFLLTRAITKPVTLGVTFAEGMASGDFTRMLDIDQKDEIGTLAAALNNMVEKLRQVVAEVADAGETVASGSEILASASEDLSQGTNEQAAGVEEVSASIEEMNANILQNTDNAQQTEKISIQAAEDARESGQVMAEAVEAVKNIAEKIAIVEEIARQTNLLALNAAIEAARAGEHGKGFAVVAAEVRKLAERSGSAAAEIGELSASTVGTVTRAGDKLDTLVPDIQKTAALVQEIAAASTEQQSGAEQIGRAVQQLNQAIQGNASASEEMSSTSEELASQAQQLQITMEFFKVNGNGNGNAPRSRSLSAEIDKPQALQHQRNNSIPSPKPRTPQVEKEQKMPDETKSAHPTGIPLNMSMNDENEFERF